MSNNLGLISAASLNESADFTLDEATSTARRYLSAIASNEDFVTKVAIALLRGSYCNTDLHLL
jgi:hypothetical protein